MNVHEALQILQEKGITSSEQMVRRWLRSGELRGTIGANRKTGYTITEKDLEDFIERRLAPDPREELEALRTEADHLRELVSKLQQENTHLRQAQSIAENANPEAIFRTAFKGSKGATHIIEAGWNVTVCNKKVDRLWIYGDKLLTHSDAIVKANCTACIRNCPERF